MAKEKKKSEYESVKYEKLQQDDNEEEDDDVMFSREGIVSKVYSQEDMVLNGNNVHLEKATLMRKSDASIVHFRKSGFLSRTRNLCFLLIILGCVCLVLFFWLLLPLLRTSVAAGVHQVGTPPWEKNLFNYSTESCIRLYDVDGDGQDDIIFGTGKVDRIMYAMRKSHEEMKQFCQNIGLERRKCLMGPGVPCRVIQMPICDVNGQSVIIVTSCNGQGDYCVGSVVALRGYDGQFLWEFPTLGTVFEINCGHVDVNLDGHADCVGTGRYATVVAFDPRNGQVLWRINDTILHGSWNTYNVLVLPDLTGDGVKDILLPHGGDPIFPPEVHVRNHGELILMDGSNGQILGQRLKMKDSHGNKETYMSPVLHTTRDGSMYILYGSGGETVGGSFYAISLPDFYYYVMGTKLSGNITGPGKYQDWGSSKHKSAQGIIEIYKSGRKGVMVPPILLEMTGDGVKDILMLAYDGIVTLYNGETLQPIWTANFSGFETYSSPAPGFFTDDDTMDFMLHLSSGFWPEYNHSLTVIVDGSNGEVVWSVKSSRYEMSSDLVAMTTEPHQDLFVFRIQGRMDLSEKKHEEESMRRKREMNKPTNGRPTFPHEKTDSLPGDESGNLPNKMPASEQGFASQNQPRDGHPGQNEYYDSYGAPFAYKAGNYEYRDQDEQGDDQYEFPDSEQDDPDSVGSPPEYGGYDSTPGGVEDTGEQHPYVVLEDFDPNFECTDGAIDRTTEIYIVDRSSLFKPIRIFSQAPEKLYYNMTDIDQALVETMNDRHNQKEALHKGGTGTNQDRSRRHGTGDEHPPARPVDGYRVRKPYTGPLCMLFKTSEKTTGALGDVDGDGQLDLVFLLEMSGGRHDAEGSYFYEQAKVRVVKMNLKQAIEQGQSVDLHPQVSTKALKQGGKATQQLTFKKMQEQSWASYLGSLGDSIFHT